MRVLKWIVDRVHGNARAVESPIGWEPFHEDLYWNGLDFPKEKFNEIMAVHKDVALAEANDEDTLFAKFGDKLPKEMKLHQQMLIARLERSPEHWEIHDPVTS